MRRGAVAALLLGLTLAACGPDPEQGRLCSRLIGAFERTHAATVLGTVSDERGLVVDYEVGGERHWVACRFGGSGLARDRLTLTAVATDREGQFSAIGVHMVRRWLGMFEAQRSTGGVVAVARGLAVDLAYLGQQLLNAVTVGAVYGLLAIGYSLVYGIIGRLNLAFGDLATIGAFTAFLGATSLALAGVSSVPLVLLSVLAMAVVVGAVHGWATQRLVFRPLAAAPSQTPLIATVGLAIFLEEYLRLTQGPRDRWLQPVMTERVTLGETGGFAVTLGHGQATLIAVSGLLFGGLMLVLYRSRFGRELRATADDPRMASLVGVNVDRTVAGAFVIGAALAAVAGYAIAVYYGGVDPYMGYALGIKALAAAVAGGIGSAPGAMLGGLLVAAVETLWVGYLTIAYRDIAAFGVLILFLLVRPDGLLGVPRSRGD